MAWNNEDPVSSPALERMLSDLCWEYVGVFFETFDVFRPIDEGIFIEFFNRKVDTLVEGALIELLF